MIIKFQQSAIAGVAGAVAMALSTYISGFVGLYQFSPPIMASMLLGYSIYAGWVLHLIVGIIFALAYTNYLEVKLIQIENKYMKGVIFGLAAFVFSQILIAVILRLEPWLPLNGLMMRMFLPNLITHVVFGLVTVMAIKEDEPSEISNI